jgi:hypothetical protein
MRKTFAYRIKSGQQGHPRAQGEWSHVQEHILVAEKALGHYLPAGAEVHHVDGNGRNNANRNLVICHDKAYHKLLHWRERVLKAGGDPNTGNICNVCREFKAFNAFSLLRSNKSTGRGGTCRPCAKVQFKAWAKRRKKAA